MVEPRNTGTDPADTGVVAPLASHLAVAATALLAGFLLGGWVAFETGYWRGFRAWVEGLADGVAVLAFVLLLVAVGVSVAATYRRGTTG